MKTKTLSLVGLSILMLIFLLGITNASLSFDNVTGDTQTISQGNTATITFNLTESGYDNLTSVSGVTPIALSGPSIFNPSLNFVGLVATINKGDTVGPVTVTFDVPSSQKVGTYTGNITIEGEYASSVDYDLPISITVEQDQEEDFCTYETSGIANPGELKLKIKDLNNKGEGEEDKWYPVDEIEVELEIENDGDEDIDDITIEYGLYDAGKAEWVIEVDDVEDLDLKDGDEETITFTIDLYEDLDIDLDELDDGDYTLYVRAIGETEDSELDTCVSDSETIEVIIENNLVVLDNIQITGDSLCGNIIQLTAEVINIGDDDQEDVSVLIENSELGILEDIAVGDIDAFEDKKISFEFTIPEDSEEKKYSIRLEVYDEDNEIYENEDDDESIYSVSLDVSGNCNSIPDAVVYASLESGGKAGEEMQIKATVTNTGDKDTFTINIADYSSWAELIEITPSSVNLDNDESKDVLITLKVNKDVEGEKFFNILLEGDSQDSLSQPVSVTIEDSGFRFFDMDNLYLYGIVALNLIIIIAIIVIVIRAQR